MKKRKVLGQTLFEVTIALGIAVLVITGITAAATLSVRNANFAKNQARATSLSQEGLEWVRAQRNYDWDTFSSRSNITLCIPEITEILDWKLLSVAPCPEGDIIDRVFSRTAKLLDITDLETGNVVGVNVIVEVFWEDKQGKHSSRVETDFSQP